VQKVQRSEDKAEPLSENCVKMRLYKWLCPQVSSHVAALLVKVNKVASMWKWKRENVVAREACKDGDSRKGAST
jgi:hypothetical protein